LDFVPLLESRWTEVRDEMLRVNLGHFTAWPEKNLYDYDSGWPLYGLYGQGRKVERNCALCPCTTALVEQVPGVITAGFSRLEPRTHIPPHHGHSDRVQRCHLPLKVPRCGQCALRVGEDILTWTPGRCLVFDDSIEHEAWNDTEEERIVLMIELRQEFSSRSVPATAEEPFHLA
jgi:beta-hydroxylase